MLDLTYGENPHQRAAYYAEAGARTIKVEAPDGLVVRADRGQLRRALLNLAKNGVSAATPSGEVVLSGTRNGLGARLEVRDDGPGVPADLREQIFAPFFTTREKGTGLGLAFVRDIARDHGGDVTVDDAPGGGARFALTLPSA